MSAAPTNSPRSRPRRLPPGTVAAAAVLLLVPIVAMAIVPVYSRRTPELWGFPFFYWYSILWTILTPAFTYAAFLVIDRARRAR
jgi:hypothetical protein